MVVKRDGRRNRSTPIRYGGIRKACEKASCRGGFQEKTRRGCEQEVFNTLASEVTTRDIGEIVMKKLKDVDEVAYVRFASVYREFKDTQTFMKELQHLLDEKN